VRPPTIGEESSGTWAEQQALPDEMKKFRLTMPGWKLRNDLQFKAPTARRAFMALQFGDAELIRVIEDCFKPAATRAGFDLRMLTDGQGAGLIDDQMRVALRTSRFIVADLTHGNRGAYWESGFAEGLGRPVFYTCRSDVWNDVSLRPHFDTRHMATVIWDPANLQQAENQLSNMIRATLPTEAKLQD